SRSEAISAPVNTSGGDEPRPYVGEGFTPSHVLLSVLWRQHAGEGLQRGGERTGRLLRRGGSGPRGRAAHVHGGRASGPYGARESRAGPFGAAQQRLPLSPAQNHRQ